MSRCSAADAAAADADDICRFCGYRDITASIKLDFRAREELTNRRRLRNTLKMLRFLTIACLICNYGIRPAEAQGRVYKGRVEPTWNTAGTRFWYRNRLPGDGQEFLMVDAENGIRRPAFDVRKVAAALSAELNETIVPEKLPVSSLRFAPPDAPDGLILSGPAGDFLWQTDTQTLISVPRQNSTSTSLFLPPVPSRGTSDGTELEIHNQTEQTISLIWISTAGEERHYADIAAGQKHQQHSWGGHVWLIRSADQNQAGCFRVPADGISISVTDKLLANVQQRRRNRDVRRPSPQNPVSPDGHWQPVIREHNLWLKDLQKNTEIQLTSSGNPRNTFRRDAQRARAVSMNYTMQDFPDSLSHCEWSPDSQYLLAWHTTQIEERSVYYVESTPADALQPQLNSYPYQKPGDPIPQPTPHLFNVKDGRSVEISTELFPNPWSLAFQRWSEDGSRFWLMYNERGHQRMRLLEVTAATGAVRTVIDEHSSTFIHYSSEGKTELKWLSDETALWTSERSGWNHLYRIDLNTGTVRNSLTAGDWNIRRIERIDQGSQTVWFYAVGAIAGQDPGHEHFCRVQMDGTNFRILTPGDGFHRIQWSPDRRWLIDRWSRTDLPPVTELRNANGELVCSLEQADASEIPASGYSLPIRFAASGRDGRTPIWGIIHLPRNFSPQKTYPVVENIYAGPHDYHVPKEFRSVWGHQRQIADAGFIVVQIDGMGTAWRSREFHNVCWQNLRDAGFPDRIAWMKAAARSFPAMDISRVGIYGGSAGGQNAMAALLWHGDFYHAAVADCGCHDNRMDKIWWNEQWLGVPEGDVYERNSNAENAHQLQGKLMLVVGEQDRNVDPATTFQVARKLIQARKDFDFLVVPGAGHGACETPWASRKRLEFLQRHLQAEAN